MNFKKLILPFSLGVFISLTIFFSLKFNEEKETAKQLETKLEKQVLQNNKLKDSLNKLSVEYKEYNLRKKAIKISGIDIPEKFKYKQIKKVFEECKKNEIPPRIAFRMIKAESNFTKNAKSSKGANGFFQIMPNTYRAYSKKLNIKKHDDLANIEVGIFYLKTLHKSFRKEDSKDRWRLAILSYNYGIGRVGNNKDKFLGKGFDNYKYLNFITS